MLLCLLLPAACMLLCLIMLAAPIASPFVDVQQFTYISDLQLTSKVWRRWIAIFHIFFVHFRASTRLLQILQQTRDDCFILLHIYIKLPFPRSFLPIKGHAYVTLRFILLFPGNAKRQRIPNFLRQLTTSILSEFSSLLFVLPSTNIRFFLFLRDLRELITCAMKATDNDKKWLFRTVKMHFRRQWWIHMKVIALFSNSSQSLSD